MAAPTVNSVTVIVPWYGVQITDVLRVVRSVDRQTYRGPLELVLCDDGSPAASAAELAEALAARPDGRVPITMCRHEQRRGPAAARNTAARRERTDWLLWVDADDALTPEAVARMTTAATQPGVALVTAQCWVLNGERRSLRRPEVYLRLAGEHLGTVSDPFAQVVFSLHPQMIRRDAFDQLGGFDESCQRAEMTDLFLRFASSHSVSAIRAIADPLYLHYRRRGSLSSDRARMDAARRRVLLAYSRRRQLPIDDVTYIGRCQHTGARHYAPIVRGEARLPPYVELRADGVHIAPSPADVALTAEA